MSILLTSCSLFLMKPKISKSEYYQEGKEFNYYKYFSEGFEGQLSDNADEMIHINYEFHDSTYHIEIRDLELGEWKEYEFEGKVTVEQDGTINLHGKSPFKNNEYKFVMRGGMGTRYAKFKLNKEFKRKFPFTNRWRYAYCESSMYTVEDCYEN